jgi:protein-tyrosine-phosphatase
LYWQYLPLSDWERYLRKLLPKKIDSAGTGAFVDHAADESAIKIALKWYFIRGA